MLGPTHAAAGGAFAGLMVPPVGKALGMDLGPEEIGIGIGIGTIAGVLPDIDHPNSFITKGIIPGWKRLGPVGRGLGFLLSIPPRIVGVGARATMNHRGGTHSALFMVGWALLAAPLYSLVALIGVMLASIVLGALGGILPAVPEIDVGAAAEWLLKVTPQVMPLVALSVFFGYLAHLVTDSMTNVPVPWPWPFSKARISLLPKPFRITTGSITEKVLIRPIFIALMLAALAWNVVIPMGETAVTATQEKISGEESPKPKKDKQAKQTKGKKGGAKDGGAKKRKGISRYDQP